MLRTIRYVLAGAFLFAFFQPVLGQQAIPTVAPVEARPADLITPVNPEPITIDEAIRRRVGIIGKPARKVILFVCDGMSASMLTLGRAALHGRDGMLALDKLPVVGRMIGYPKGGQVNDSAAAGSQFSTGRETINGRIAVDDQYKPLETIFEAARKRGFRVGVVSDTRLTHATPAAFSAHQNDRDEEEAIAAQQVRSEYEVLLSGGRKKFGKELDEAVKRGYRVVSNRRELLSAVAGRSAKLLGLFADSYLPYSFERKGDETPTLSEMAAAAVSLLDRGDKGFLLMVEAGKIDATMHAHDAAEGVAQMRAMDEALRKMVEFVKTNHDALLVVVSDHATGGLQVIETFDPARFNALATSTIALAAELKGKGDAIPGRLKAAFPGVDFSKAELDRLVAAHESRTFELQLGSVVFAKFGLTFHAPEVEDAMQDTHGHTGEDLFIHAMGAHQNLFGGVLRSWEIPRRIGIAIGIKFP
ncbi:MAG TPA: alkaline phosphatase [Candidatus Ozemobacteraceae bacterium]|nr:alkaline phosphatase [Candidatus Ozemobacteraceae bacterium]